MSRYWVIEHLEPDKHLTELQRLRARRTPSLKTRAREAAYTVGLTQAEDLWLAADRADPLADPILRYYALAQAAQALAASSPLPDDAWQPGHSHGLKCKVSKTATRLEFSEVLISPSGNGLAQVLAAALGSRMIPRDTKLSDLIGSLWHNAYSCEEPIHDSMPRRPLHVRPGVRDNQGRLRVDLVGDLWTANNRNMLDLKYFLYGYPGLRGCLPSEVTHRTPEEGEAFVWLTVGPDSPLSDPQTWLDNCDVGPDPEWLHQIGGARQSIGTVTFLPGFNGDDSTIHPLLSWFLVLYGFSMLARYHGRGWRGRLDLDYDGESVDLRNLVSIRSADAMSLLTRVIHAF